MKRVCSWCGKDMGEKPGGEGITDGICEECIVKVLAEADGQDPTFSDGGRISPPLPAPSLSKEK